MKAVALVAATYIYFLVFAQFAFLAGVQAAGGDVQATRFVLGSMALAGIAGSFVAAACIARRGPAGVMRVGALVASTSALVAAACFDGMLRQTPAVLSVVAAATGGGLAFTTVSVASILGRLVRGGNPGLHVGAGTALAYLVANVPWVFHARPAAQSVFAASVLLAVAVLAAWIPSASAAAAGHAPSGCSRAKPGRYSDVVGATVVFLALVWFDSAAFAAVQNTPAQRDQFWGTASTLWANGAWHALAALAAGWALARGGLRILWIASLAGLIGGAWAFHREGPATMLAAPLYVSAVSAYSTALAAYAAMRCGATDTTTAAWCAAFVYGIAGWAGSTAGIGLVVQEGRLPAWAPGAAAGVFTFGILLARVRRQSEEPHPQLSI